MGPLANSVSTFLGGKYRKTSEVFVKKKNYLHAMWSCWLHSIVMKFLKSEKIRWNVKQSENRKSSLLCAIIVLTDTPKDQNLGRTTWILVKCLDSDT